MNKEQFWEIIEIAKQESNGELDQMETTLVNQLSELPKSDILIWQKILYEYQNVSYRNNLYAAACVIYNGCGDDLFDYFREWLIAQGKDVFMQVLANPDQLANYVQRPDCDGFERYGNARFEGLLNVALDAFYCDIEVTDNYESFIKGLKDHSLSKDMMLEIRNEFSHLPDINEDWTEDMLPTLFPKLVKKMNPDCIVLSHEIC